MRTTCVALLAITLSLAEPRPRFDGRSLWHHIEVLADDNMEGPATGTSGLERAEAHVVGRLQGGDLRPAGGHGFYQPVSFKSRTIIEQDCDAALIRAGTPEPLVLGKDGYFSGVVDLAPAVEAPLVFVGYGL